MHVIFSILTFINTEQGESDLKLCGIKLIVFVSEESHSSPSLSATDFLSNFSVFQTFICGERRMKDKDMSPVAKMLDVGRYENVAKCQEEAFMKIPKLLFFRDY